MRLFRSKIIAFLLLLVIPVAGNGMGLVEHSCLMNDSTTLSFEKKKGCCERKAKKDCHQTTSTQQSAKWQKTPCCQDQTLVVHIDFAGFSQKLTTFLADLSTTISQTFVTLVRSFVLQKEATLQHSNSSPPLSGRDILTRHCTYRI